MPWCQFLRGFDHLREAFRLLARRPGLLALPLLVVCFNAVEQGLSQHVYLHGTKSGRQLAQTFAQGDTAHLAEQMRSERFRLGYVLSDTTRSGLHALEQPIPGPGFAGTGSVLYLSVAWWDDLVRDHYYLFPLLTALIVLVFVIPLAALFLAWFYGIVRDYVVGASTPPDAFRLYLRRYYLRFLTYLVFWKLASAALLEVGVAPLSPLLGSLLRHWLQPLLLLPLALGLIAIVTDDLPSFAALRRSALAILRGLPVIAAFLVAVLVPVALVGVYHSWLGIRILGAFSSPYTSGALWARALSDGVHEALLAVLGLWLLLAMFLWYRDANPAPVAVEQFEAGITDESE